MTKKELSLFDDLMNYTTNLSFPFIANNEKKQKILSDIKNDIDKRFLVICGDCDFSKCKDDLWKQAQEMSKKEFEDLPDKIKLNSFYLQEVMSQYVLLVREWYESI